MTANLNRLKSLAKKNITNKYTEQITIDAIADKIDMAIDSLHDREDFTKYYYNIYIENIKNFKSILQLISKKEGEIAIKANLISCMQNLHILHDVLSYIISLSLDMKIEDKDITFYKLKKHLEMKNKQEYKTLISYIDELSKKSDYKYLNANVNHSKHRYHIDLDISIDMKEYPPKLYSLFRSFDYHSLEKKNTVIHYPEMDASLFLIREYNRETELIIKIENELIYILENIEDN